MHVDAYRTRHEHDDFPAGGESAFPRVMNFVRYVAVLLAFVWTMGAFGQEPRGSGTPIVLHVACGGLFRSPCVKAVPKIAAQTAGTRLELKPEGSGRTLDTAAAVCEGQTEAAIVQRDAIALTERQPFCRGRYHIVGRPIFPYYAFLIVRADAPYHQFDDLAGNGNPPSNGRRRLVMAGAEGTGGQITLSWMLRSNPRLKRAIAVLPGDLDVGLQRVAAGAIDGYFTVDTLDSEMIDRVLRAADAHRKPLFMFIDIRPQTEFFRIGDFEGNCLYRLTGLDFGDAVPVTTTSVDAVMVLGRAFHDAHAKGVSDTLTSAIDTADAAILTAMNSPSDWHPAGASCK
jgi:hypothetical protein